MNSTASRNPLVEPTSEVVRVLETYLKDLEQGRNVNVDDLVKQHPDLADALRACLAGLDVLHAAALKLRQSSDAAATTGDLPVPACLGDFRLLREQGRGGMGVVYEAEQISLSRRVALKVLPFAAALDAKQLQRFKHEAMAAAQLHHQHIVPVYHVGNERGVHFYAMQFIDGHTMAALITDLRSTEENSNDAGLSAAGMKVDALAENTPRTACPTPPEASRYSPAFFRRAAGLGLQAALALEHAHQVGIVHRDIKPANLIVDVSGNLWITDFGLAHFHKETRLTLTGDVIGTLRYMSPEQALGNRAIVDQRADIYSLGVTLYELLTLEPAFRGGDRAELLRRINQEEPIPPRRLNNAMPTDLETIVLKAMAKNPEERYSTAQDLAADLQRFLKDEPIHARRPTLVQRARKWARRHKALVQVTMASLVVALAGLAVATWLIWQAYSDKANALSAEIKERRRAVSNMQLTLDALERVYLRLAEHQLPRDPQREREDREVLNVVLDFYERFAQQNSSERSARALTAKAYFRVANLRANLGQHGEAKPVFDRAVAMWQELVTEFPAMPEYRNELAVSHNNLGIVLRELDQIAEAEHQYRRALEIMTSLVAECADQPEFSAGAADVHHNLGNLSKRSGDWQAAATHYRNAMNLRAKVAAEFPTNGEYQRVLARSHSTLGNLLSARKDIPAAVKHHTDALTILTRLTNAAPASSIYRQDLAACLTCLGAINTDRGEAAPALAYYRHALKLQTQLSAEFPTIPAYRRDKAIGLYHVGSALSQTGETEAAVKHHKEALDLCSRLTVEFPSVPENFRFLAGAHFNLGNHLLDRGDYAAAAEQFKSAIAALAPLTTEASAPVEYRFELAENRHNLAYVLHKRGHLSAAAQEYRQALDLFSPLAGDVAAPPQYRYEVARCHGNLAELLAQNKDPVAAAQHCREALAVRERLAADFPSMARYRRDLAGSHHNLGLLLEDSKDPAWGKHIGYGLEIRDRLVAEFPGDAKCRAELATSADSYARWLVTQGKRPEAVTHYRKAVQLLRQLVSELPRDLSHSHALGAALHDLALVRRDQSELMEARDLFKEAIVHQRAALAENPKHAIAREFLRKHYTSAAGILLQLGDHAEAAKAAAQLVPLYPAAWQEYYRSAAFLAQCTGVVEKDGSLTQKQRREHSERYASQSVSLLGQAVEKGYPRAASIRTAPVFEPLRARDDFQELLKGVDGNK